jgi:hypothetical protein
MSEWSRRAPLLSVDGPGRPATAPSHGRIAPRYCSSAWSSRQSGGGCGAASAVHRCGALASQEEAVVWLVPFIGVELSPVRRRLWCGWCPDYSGLSAMRMNLLEPGGWSRRTAGLHFKCLLCKCVPNHVKHV